MPTHPSALLLTKKEAGRILGIGTDFINGLIKQGKLRVRKIGAEGTKSCRVTRESVEEFARGADDPKDLEREIPQPKPKTFLEHLMKTNPLLLSYRDLQELKKQLDPHDFKILKLRIQQLKQK